MVKDRWSREGMPDGDALRRIQSGVDATMKEVVANRNIPQSASMIPDRQRSVDEPHPASGGTVEVRPPPGLRWVDQQCDAADRRDRVVAIRQQAEAAWIEAHFEEGPRIESEYNPFDSARIKEK